jgi:hypothetical protein
MVLQRCIKEGLVGGEGFGVDASLIKADAHRQKGIEGKKGLPPGATGRAVQEYLAVLDDAAFGAATRPSSSRQPIRRLAGPELTAGKPSSLIPPVILSTSITRSSSMSKPPPQSAKRMIERSVKRFDL